MSIPMRLKKIRYKAAGKYAYEGDLIITHGVVYYFPHTDLIQQRINRASSAVGTIVTGGIGGALGGLGGRMIRGLQLSDSAEYDEDLLQAKQASSVVQEKLDAYITELKANRSSVTLSTYLPLPLRYTSDAVKKLSLTFRGVLAFEAHYDTHEYRIGIFKKKLVRQCLTDAGFMPSSTSA